MGGSDAKPFGSLVYIEQTDEVNRVAVKEIVPVDTQIKEPIFHAEC